MASEPLTIREFIKTQSASGFSTVDPKWVYSSLLLVTVAFGLIFLQPFGLNEIGSSQRITYWAFISVMGYCLYGSIFFLGGKIFAKISLNFPYPFPVVACGFLASTLMSLAVLFAGSIFFDIQASYNEQFLVVFPQTLAIGTILLVIIIATDYVSAQNTRLQRGRDAAGLNKLATDAFLQNIPISLRGELLCLKTEDHYLQVYTDKGRHLLLMRLTDAMAMLEDVQGLKVHRSWWVSDSAVMKAIREDRKISLLLKNDLVVPVSRRFSSDVRKRGFLR